MTPTPSWPGASGPRVLMLVANDMTIDTRVRKTASSVARAGYSVICVGVDPKAASLPDEMLDGALLSRVNDPADPRISPRSVRLSRPELTHAAQYRTETRKQRLHVARRELSSEVSWGRAHPPRWVDRAGTLAEGATRQLRIGDDISNKVGRKITQLASRIHRSVRYGPMKARALYHQAVHQLLLMTSRVLARPSQRWLRKASWHRDLPDLHRFEAILGSMVNELNPDLIHVHDVFLLGVAVRASARINAAGGNTKVLYDAHEYVRGLPIDQRRRKALTDLEQEHLRYVDAVTTVSEGLADLLEQDYGHRPAVVMNAPDMARQSEVESISEAIGIGPEVNLIVYVGGVAPHRGAEVLIAALELLPTDAHLAFITNSTTGYVADLSETAAQAGLSERVHLAPYVVPEGVVSYIRSASVSAVPLSRQFTNYEVALPNKLFQSIHAQLPVVVSDNPEMKRFVTHHGVGEVFQGGDAHSLAKAIQTVLDDPERYLTALSNPALLRETSWDAQMETLIESYEKLGIVA